MTATNRGGTRSPADNYPTPDWCVHRLLEAVDLPAGAWLEPCAGDGAIIQAVDIVRDDVVWLANELRAECLSKLNRHLDTGRIHISDFMTGELPWREKPEVVISNPPFSIAFDVVKRSLELAAPVVMLQRLSFLASAARNTFMRTHAPDVYVIPNRPSFVAGRTDSDDYAWFLWPTQHRRSSGAVRVLRNTPTEERRAK